MKHKTLPFGQIKTEGDDIAEGEFTGLGAAFDNVDAHGDIIRKGAFARSLKSGEVIPLLWHHNVGDPRAFVGEVVEASETDAGLLIKGRFDLDTDSGRAAYRQVKGRRVTGLSIGYRVGKSAKNPRGNNELLDVDLLEISCVSRPANDRARVAAVKTISVSADQALAHYRAAAAAKKGIPMKYTDQIATLTKGIEEQRSYVDAIIENAEALGRELSDDEAANVDQAAKTIERANAALAKARKGAARAAADEPIIAAFSKSAPGVTPINPTGEPVERPRQSEGKGFLTRDVLAKAAGEIAYAAGERAAGLQAGSGMALKAVDGVGMTDRVIVDFVAQPQVPTTLLDVIPVRPTASPTFRYIRQTSRTNRATVVPAGTTKPTSEFGLETVDGALAVVAHLSDAIDTYALADVAGLEEFITAELQWGLLSAVEAQVINGNGTAPNLRGVLATSGLQVQTFVDDLVTTTRSAVTKLEAAGYASNAIALRPEDWATIELSASPGSGEYVLGTTPVDRAARRLWGLPVVVSTALPVGTALLLSTDSVHVYTDGSVNLDWDKATGFSKNQVIARLEGRFAVAVKRPFGVVKITTADEG